MTDSTMETPSDPSSQQAKRSANACERCRARKVKCSGVPPCRHCSKKNVECVFPEEEGRKVYVSERYLEDLKRKCQVLDNEVQPAMRKRLRKQNPVDDGKIQRRGNDAVSASSRQIHTIDTNIETTAEPSEGTPTEPFERNPLVSKTQSYIKDGSRYRFLGPSSTWGFSRRVIALLEHHFPNPATDPDPINYDGCAYELKWSRVQGRDIPDLTGLPSLDHAIFYLNNVKFQLCQIFRVVHEEEFLRNLYEFYDNAEEKVKIAPLWFIQYLLILAFGKAILVQSNISASPPGVEYFTRAMSLLPDFQELQKQSLISIEILCLVSLYLQSIEWRISAFGYIGNALRLCFVEGIQRQVPVEVFGKEYSNRCNQIWWTVYILDRDFSSLMGAPTSISDDDITVDLPSVRDPSHRAAAMTLHVKISSLMARILKSVYFVDGKLNGFLAGTKSVLRDLAELLKELEDLSNNRLSTSVGGLSRVATHMHLAWHHCVVLACRPLIMCILERRIVGFTQQRELSAPIAALVRACVESAVKVLKILAALKEHDLLETFLPFHLQDAFSTAFILHIISATLPTFTPDHEPWCNNAYLVLDAMIERNNVPAKLRKAELDHLNLLLNPLHEQNILHQKRGLSNSKIDHGSMTRSSVGSMQEMTITHNATSEDWHLADFEMDPTMGMSPSYMLSMASALGNEVATYDQDQWLWDIPELQLAPNST